MVNPYNLLERICVYKLIVGNERDPATQPPAGSRFYDCKYYCKGYGRYRKEGKEIKCGKYIPLYVVEGDIDTFLNYRENK